MHAFNTPALLTSVLTALVTANPIETSFAKPTVAGWTNPVKDTPQNPTATSLPRDPLADWGYGPRSTGSTGPRPIVGVGTDPMCLLKAKRQTGGKPAVPNGRYC
jgi:hypothetical protein